MKFCHSIQWRLQVWHGLVLVLVLTGFGFTAWQMERNQALSRVDDELRRREGMLASAMHPPPPRGPHSGFFPPPPDDSPPFAPPDKTSPEDSMAAHNFVLRPEDTPFFDSPDPHKYFYRIFLAGRREDMAQPMRELARSPLFPASLAQMPPWAASEGANPTGMGPGGGPLRNPHRIFSDGPYRIVVDRLPSGEVIETGCVLDPEWSALKMAALRLSGFGLLILALGLTGGRWLAGRALSPLAEISAAAGRISAGNLKERIELEGMDSELGQLAMVLNATFSRLEKAFAQQQQFTADAAHELRTPVTVMLTQAQTALSRERDAAGYRQALEACLRAAQRMRRLIETLLALARLEAGQEFMKMTSVNLASVTEETVRLLTPLAEEKQIEIRHDLKPVLVKGDHARLGQVVENLVANAIQYNREKGWVQLTLTCEENAAVLKVADCGRGIPAEVLPHVFERFRRADPSRTGSGNSGLGLAISRAIVMAHNGDIEVDSRENDGTVFRVKLPISSSASASEASSDGPSNSGIRAFPSNI